MTSQALEVNFDALVGPSHNYAGLSYGNIASMEHRLEVSNPRAAVIQGLELMKLLMDLGVKVAVLPPHERPDVRTLRNLGFGGSDAEVLSKAAHEAPSLFAACYSASSMWAANAATVSPAADTDDHRVHITPANLVSNFHRSLECEFTGRLLRAIFSDENAFVHHPPLPRAVQLSDEGAANHIRLCKEHGRPGLEIFVYGRSGFAGTDVSPRVYPARQSLEASEVIARNHRLLPQRTLFVRQNPLAVDAGVFHNDVISVGNEMVFLYHSQAFAGGEAFLRELRASFMRECDFAPVFIRVDPVDVSPADAVRTYLFNSRLVTTADGSMCLIAPVECREDYATRRTLERLQAEDNPISGVHYADIRQSMRNGGGPACLRLRVVLTEAELHRTNQGVLLDPGLYERLVEWAHRHYRDRLSPDDLVDPYFPDEIRFALDELTQLLGLGALYEFQRDAPRV